MSRAPNAFRPVVNGGGGSDGRNKSTSGGLGGGYARDRRPGGYGGFISNNDSQDAPLPIRPTNLERTRAQRRSGGDRDWSSSRSRSRPGFSQGPGSERMEDILQYIQQHFPFMAQDNCNSIQVALQLMDTSSLGLADQRDQFTDTSQQLQDALKSIVNEHHQGFNSSIGTFHTIQASLQTSQTRVRELRNSLVEARSSLLSTKPELEGLIKTSQNYEDMLQVMGQIEDLQQMPAVLEAQITKKQFYSAVETLQDALRLIRRSDMESIGALSELRVYFSNQEQSLADILVEELHNHLYLKSPYCENRWKSNVGTYRQEMGDAETSLEGNRRVLFEFLDEISSSDEAAVEYDMANNPEADTYRYILLILESLNKMNRLESAMEGIEQRLPVELFKILDKSNTEVEMRHPSAVRSNALQQSQRLPVRAGENEAATGILQDLLAVVYAKFESIAEAHLVVHSVVKVMARRDSLPDNAASTRNFAELWKLYQSEIRSLLHDYLAVDGASGFRSGQNNVTGSQVFSRLARDKNAKLFDMSELNRTDPALNAETEDLMRIFKAYLPGLAVGARKSDADASSKFDAITERAGTGHKLLALPSVFNMSILLPPSLTFLRRLRDLVPTGSAKEYSNMTSFLDDFLINVFQPQLEETLLDVVRQTLNSPEALTVHPQWEFYGQKPLNKASIDFFEQITAFCTLLDTLSHDQALSELVIDQMRAFNVKSVASFQDSLSRLRRFHDERKRLKLLPTSAEIQDIKELLATIDVDGNGRRPSMLPNMERTVIQPEADFIYDQSTVAALCLLYRSTKWLARKLQGVRRISDRANESSRKRDWIGIGAAEIDVRGTEPYLPLNERLASAFDAVLVEYFKLATRVVATLKNPMIEDLPETEA